MYGFKILYEISKGTFEISHKVLNPYTAKYAFYCLQFFRVSYDIFGLWCHKPLWHIRKELVCVPALYQVTITLL